MAHIDKSNIICPICGSIAEKISPSPNLIYSCNKCDFYSSDENCVDVSYSDALSAPLSNLYPHDFNLYYSNSLMKGVISCPSMESFLQGLKIKDPTLQFVFMTTYSGMSAKKMSMILDDWKKDKVLYFAGQEYKRESKEYTELITSAYDALFASNKMFREIVLPRFKGYTIIHSIGNDNPNETVLTEMEFRYQINRLISKLPK